jgi:rare lipoprotein A
LLLLLPSLEVKPVQLIQAASSMPLAGMQSLVQHRCTTRSGLDGGRAARAQPRAAAIKTSLREKFGGVQYGARPKYALVEAVGKKVIVKINDVGPLTPGRIIDLNERTMRLFDPSLELGVIYGVTVRPLSGDYWIPGPVG